MPTLMIFHEVDDVEHWLSSPKREEVFGPLGITVRTFIDPAKSTVWPDRQVPDMESFQRIMESEAAAEAMKFDGVRPDTILVLVEPERLGKGRRDWVRAIPYAVPSAPTPWAAGRTAG